MALSLSKDIHKDIDLHFFPGVPVYIDKDVDLHVFPGVPVYSAIYSSQTTKCCYCSF